MMQGILQTRSQLFRRTRIFRHVASYHKQSIHKSKTMLEAFFVGRSLQPIRSSFNRGIFHRTFASGRGRGSFANYTSAYYTIWGFIGLNTVVFGAWQYAQATKDRNLLTKMSRNFTISLQNLKDGRWYTILTAAISQQNVFHFLFNMISFHTFGSLLTAVGVGGPHIMSLCLGSALISSGVQLYQWSGDTSDPLRSLRSGLGASGVVMGTAAVATCLVPTAPILIFPFPFPIPLWGATLLFVGVDTFYLHADSRVGHAAHLGGSAFGLLYYAARLRRFGGIWYLFRR